MKKIVPSIAAAVSAYFVAGGNTYLPAQSSNPAPQFPVNIVADVYANYFAIQKALAQDSLEGVPGGSLAIARLVGQDASSVFQPEIIGQAQILASAPNLPSARQSFKSISGYLIQTWRAGHGPGGVIHELYSPADNVDWLEEGEVVQNPYRGKACQHCGVFVR